MRGSTCRRPTIVQGPSHPSSLQAWTAWLLVSSQDAMQVYARAKRAGRDPLTWHSPAQAAFRSSIRSLVNSLAQASEHIRWPTLHNLENRIRSQRCPDIIFPLNDEGGTAVVGRQRPAWGDRLPDPATSRAFGHCEAVAIGQVVNDFSFVLKRAIERMDGCVITQTCPGLFLIQPEGHPPDGHGALSPICASTRIDVRAKRASSMAVRMRSSASARGKARGRNSLRRLGPRAPAMRCEAPPHRLVQWCRGRSWLRTSGQQGTISRPCGGHGAAQARAEQPTPVGNRKACVVSVAPAAFKQGLPEEGNRAPGRVMAFEPIVGMELRWCRLRRLPSAMVHTEFPADLAVATMVWYASGGGVVELSALGASDVRLGRHGLLCECGRHSTRSPWQGGWSWRCQWANLIMRSIILSGLLSLPRAARLKDRRGPLPRTLARSRFVASPRTPPDAGLCSMTGGVYSEHEDLETRHTHQMRN